MILIAEIFQHMELVVRNDRLLKIEEIFHQLPDIVKYEYFYNAADMWELLARQTDCLETHELEETIKELILFLERSKQQR